MGQNQGQSCPKASSPDFGRGRSFPPQNLIHQPVSPRVAGKALPQRGFFINITHPIQTGDFRVGVLKGGEAFEESVQNTGARRRDMAVA